MEDLLETMSVREVRGIFLDFDDPIQECIARYGIEKFVEFANAHQLVDLLFETTYLDPTIGHLFLHLPGIDFGLINPKNVLENCEFPEVFFFLEQLPAKLPFEKIAHSICLGAVGAKDADSFHFLLKHPLWGPHLRSFIQASGKPAFVAAQKNVDIFFGGVLELMLPEHINFVDEVEKKGILYESILIDDVSEEWQEKLRGLLAHPLLDVNGVPNSNYHPITAALMIHWKNDIPDLIFNHPTFRVNDVPASCILDLLENDEGIKMIKELISMPSFDLPSFFQRCFACDNRLKYEEPLIDLFLSDARLKKDEEMLKVLLSADHAIFVWKYAEDGDFPLPQPGPVLAEMISQVYHTRSDAEHLLNHPKLTTEQLIFCLPLILQEMVTFEDSIESFRWLLNHPMMRLPSNIEIYERKITKKLKDIVATFFDFYPETLVANPNFFIFNMRPVVEDPEWGNYISALTNLYRLRLAADLVALTVFVSDGFMKV